MAGGCGVGAFCSFCGKCGRVFSSVFDDVEVPVVLPPGISSSSIEDEPVEANGSENVGEQANSPADE